MREGSDVDRLGQWVGGAPGVHDPHSFKVKILYHLMYGARWPRRIVIFALESIPLPIAEKKEVEFSPAMCLVKIGFAFGACSTNHFL